MLIGQVVLGLSDRAVLYKPPGWEEAFPGKAILQDTVHNCGFLHRLDVPNSGLLLVATSYGAYYDLQLQLAAGQLGRDYLVLVPPPPPGAREPSWRSQRGRRQRKTQPQPRAEDLEDPPWLP
eukprot:Skav211831  [mRNA]  locus=scaffold305:638288:639061:- [translate_table: standard]